MNCFYHPYNTTVAQCVDCGKGLCSACAAKYSIPICDKCNNIRKRDDFAKYLKPIIICGILFIVGYNLNLFGPSDRTFGAYMIMCVYGGWRFINQHFPRLFLVFNLENIFWFYIVKFGISMFIGFFVTPFFLGYCGYKLVRIIL